MDITKAADLLIKIPSDKRHVSTMLLSISSETAKKIANKIEVFRDEIWRLVQHNPSPSSVIMQLNLQYIPRSKMVKREDHLDNIKKEAAKEDNLSEDNNSIDT